MDTLNESQHIATGAPQRHSAAKEPEVYAAPAAADRSPCPAASNPVAPGTSRALSADERLAWWRQARFGMFIHWGPFSILGGEWQGQRVDGGVGHGVGEWIMYNAQIPVEDYARVARSFNPQSFDADDWVRLAKNTGQKYLILTTKHHDGFALFRSIASSYNCAEQAPFGRDVVAELAAACARHGIRFGLYYSQAQDWYHPGGAAFNGLRDPNAVWAGGDPAAGHWDAAQHGDFDAYLQTISLPQVRELLTNYGPIDIFWWDTPIGMTPERAQRFADLLQLQPGVLTNNRLLNPERPNAYSGDTETPEQFIPATGLKGRAFEVCMTVNDTWGYKTHDHNWKPARLLIRQLVDTVSKGGNFLLNIGPDGDGHIPAPCRERLEAVGRWMRVNGESIRGGLASPFAKLPWGRCTRRSENGCEWLYLHVFRWPQDGILTVPGLRSAVLSATLLADGTPLEVTGGGSASAYPRNPNRRHADSASPRAAGNSIEVEIHVPHTAPDADVSVVRLQMQAPLDIAPALPCEDSEGNIHLSAWQADIHNQPYCGQAVLDLDADTVAIRQWTDRHTWLSWEFEIDREGTFAVFARSQFMPVANGLSLSVQSLDADVCEGSAQRDQQAEPKKVVGMSLDRGQSDNADGKSVPQADAPGEETLRELGQLTFDGAGRYSIALSPEEGGHWLPAELTALELRRLSW